MTVCPERLAASFLRDGDRVVTVQIRDDLTAIADALDSSVDGARVVALLPCSGDAMPVGRIVDVLARHRGQAVAVVPVDDRTHPTALLLERGDAAPSTAWLPASGLVDLDAGRSARVRAELVVGGAADRGEARAFLAEAQTQRRRAEAAEVRATTAEAEVARLTAALQALRTSRSYEVGQAFAQVRSAPMSGLVQLPGRLRRAGKSSPGR